MNGKTSITFIYPDLWAPTASLLRGLTVMQHWVYQMMFKTVYEVKKWLAQPAVSEWSDKNDIWYA